MAAFAPLDPFIQSVLDEMRANNAPSLFSIPVNQARARIHTASEAARRRTPPPSVGAVEDGLAVDGPHAVPVRIYRPERSGTTPTLLFFHGGGFALGSIDTSDTLCRTLCRELGAVVVSVEYRLAPEHPFPAAHDDALAASRWLWRHIGELGGDPSRVAIFGESAGANLATSTALALADSTPRFSAQVLLVPGVDFARDVDALRKARVLHPLLTPDDLLAISRMYLAGRQDEAPRFPPSPLHAASLAGQPPAIVAVAGHDHLRDEGLRYASRLRAEGVPVTLVDLQDMPHPFTAFLGASAGADRALSRICTALLAQWKAP